MTDKLFLKLHPSEGYVLAAASRIYAAYVAADKVTGGNEMEMLEKAVDLALLLTQAVDERVQTEDEIL